MPLTLIAIILAAALRAMLPCRVIEPIIIRLHADAIFRRYAYAFSPPLRHAA